MDDIFRGVYNMKRLSPGWIIGVRPDGKLVEHDCTTLGGNSGPVGYYAERIAREGFIGMVFCGSSKMVAPSGSSERAFGSNPVAIGIPTGGEALVLDMATSAMPIFKVAEALFKGEMLPPNVGYDAAGIPTQAPKPSSIPARTRSTQRREENSRPFLGNSAAVDKWHTHSAK